MTNIEELKFDDKGLIPAIVVDAVSKKVLTLAYMNRESLKISMEKGCTCFFSRSRQELWLKGETSGNYLHVKSIAKDCDADTLLIRVVPAGPVCHTGSKTCFGGRENEGFIGLLQSVIRQRHRDMPEGSYTTKLFTKGAAKIAQKVGEEAVETVIEAVANNNPDLVYEASDLIYHLLVLLENQGLSIADLEEELAKRHK